MRIRIYLRYSLLFCKPHCCKPSMACAVICASRLARSCSLAHDGPSVGSQRHLLHRGILLDQRTHPARSAAEDLPQPGPRRPFQEPSVDSAVPGHIVLFRRHRHSRQCDAALFSIHSRERGPLLLVQRLRPGRAAGWRCLLHRVTKRMGKRLSVYRQHDSGGFLQRGALYHSSARDRHDHCDSKCYVSSRSDSLDR